MGASNQELQEQLLERLGGGGGVAALLARRPDERQLAILVALEEEGVSPEALTELQRAAEAGARPEEFEAVAREAERRGPGSTPDLPAGSETLPHRERIEASLGEPLGDLAVSTGRPDVVGPLGARAATDGRRLVFASPNPSVEEVAHEVVHALQGGEGGGRAVSRSDQAGEREAGRVAAAVARGEPAPEVRERRPAAVSRWSLGGVWDSIVGGAVAAGKQVGGFVKGVAEGAWDTLKGIGSMAWGAGKLTVGWLVAPDEARKTWEGLKQTVSAVVSDPGLLWDALTDPIVEDWKAGRYGEAIGRAAFEVASVVLGTKGLDKVVKGAKLADALGDAGKVAGVADDVGDVGKVVRFADDAGDVTKGAKAGRLADDAGEVTKGAKVNGSRESGLSETLPEHTSNRLGHTPTKNELSALKKRYQVTSDSEARALWHVEMQPSTQGIVAGEDAIKRLLGIDPKQSGIKMVDALKTEHGGLKVPIEIKNQTVIHLDGTGNSALAKFEELARHVNMRQVSHFEVIANTGSRLPPNFMVDPAGHLHRLISGTSPARWEKVLIGGKPVRVVRAGLGEISK